MDRRLRWLPALLVAVVVFIGSVAHGVPHGPVLGPLGLVGFDKYEHAVAYLALGGTLGFALGSKRTWLAILIAVAVASLYGGGIEIVQGFVGRDPSVFDWLADTIGAIIGALGAAALDPWLAKIRPKSDPEH